MGRVQVQFLWDGHVLAAWQLRKRWVIIDLHHLNLRIINWNLARWFLRFGDRSGRWNFSVCLLVVLLKTLRYAAECRHGRWSMILCWCDNTTKTQSSRKKDCLDLFLWSYIFTPATTGSGPQVLLPCRSCSAGPRGWPAVDSSAPKGRKVIPAWLQSIVIFMGFDGFDGSWKTPWMVAPKCSNLGIGRAWK